MEGQETRIVNAYEKIAANIKQDFGVGIQNIAEGVQVAGSVAENAGLSFEQFAASIAKVSEVTRVDGSTIGNAYKTILSRVSRSKEADPDTTLEDRGEAAKALSALGIEVYDQNGVYQDFSVTMDQLTEKWNTLTDAQRANIAESMAGVRNINIMQTIIDTWKEAQGLAQQTMEDPTYYLEVQEKGMDSLQSKMDTFKASLQDFWYNILDVDTIGTGIQAITLLTDGIGDFVKLAKSIPAIGGAVGIGGLLTTLIGGSSLVDNILLERGKLKQSNGSAGLFGGFKEGFKATITDISRLGLDANVSGNIASIFKDGFSQAQQAGNSFFTSAAAGAKNLWSNMTSLSKTVVGLGAAFMALDLGVKFIDAITTSAQESKEKVESMNLEFEKQRETINNNKATIDEIGSEWSLLSSGVDTNSNENISLTNDQYQRYLELNNQISEIIPSTVSGFDAQGNAILNLKGSLSELNSVFEETIRMDAMNRYNEGISDALNEFNNRVGNMGFGDMVGTILDGGSWSDFAGNESIIGRLKELKKAENFETDVLPYFNEKGGGGGLAAEINDLLGTSYETTEEEWKEILNSGAIESAIKSQQDLIDSAKETTVSMLQDYLTAITSEGGDYSDLDDNVITAVNKMIAGSTVEQIETIGNNRAKASQYVRSYLDAFKNNDSAQQSLLSLTGIDSETSLSEMKTLLDKELPNLYSALGIKDNQTKKKKQLKEQLGLDETQELVDLYSDLQKDVKKYNDSTKDIGKETKKNKKLLEDFVDKNDINTKEQLQTLKDLIKNNDTWEDVLTDWQMTSFNTDVIDSKLEMLKANLEDVKEAFENLNTAIEESNSASGLSSESIDNVRAMFGNLKGYNEDLLLESTFSGVRLNPQVLSSLTKEFKETNYEKYTGQVSELEDRYAELCLSIEDADNALQRNTLIEQRNSIKEQIKDAELLQSQYEGLTNAVNLWQQAQARGDEGALYDSVKSGFEEVKEMFDEGLIGDDSFQAFTQMFSNTDMSGMSSVDFAEMFQSKLPTMEAWFEDGMAGVNNFFKDIGKQVDGFIDENGNVNFEVLPDVETLAKQLDVSESLIDTMFKKANQYGADLDFSEASDYLRKLRQDAVEAGEALDEATREKYSVDMEVEGSDAIQEQIDRAKELQDEVGKDSDEYKYLAEQIEYLQAKSGENVSVGVDIYSAEGIENLNKDLEELNRVSKQNIEIDWENLTPEECSKKIENVIGVLESMEDENGKIEIHQEGAQEAYNVLSALQQKAWDMNSESNILLRVDSSQVDSATMDTINQFSMIQAAAYNLEQLKITPGVDDDQIEAAKTNLQELINDFTSNSGNLTATADLKDSGIDLTSSKIDQLASKLTNLNATDTLITLGVDESAIIGYQASDKQVKVNAKLNKGEVETWQPKDRKQTVNAYLSAATKNAVNTWTPARRTQYVDVVKVGKNNLNGNAHLQGNANAQGNARPSLLHRGKAFAKGTWGAVKNATSLVGELGKELVVIIWRHNLFNCGDIVKSV